MTGSNETLSPFTEREMRVLTVLHAFPHIRPDEIASVLRIETVDVRAALWALHRPGYVERSLERLDGWRARLFLWEPDGGAEWPQEHGPVMDMSQRHFI